MENANEISTEKHVRINKSIPLRGVGLSNFHCLLNGNIFCTDENIKNIIIFDVNSGKCLHTLAHPNAIKDIHFSPNKEIFVTNDEVTVRVWNAKTYALIHAIEIKNLNLPYTPSFEISDKVLTIYSSIYEGSVIKFSIRLIDIISGELLENVETYATGCSYFDDCQPWIRNDRLELWDNETKKYRHTLKAKAGIDLNAITSLGILSKDELVLYDNYTLTFWNIHTNEVKPLGDLYCKGISLLYRLNQTKFILNTYDNYFYLCDLKTAKIEKMSIDIAGKYVTQIKELFKADDDTVIISTDIGMAMLDTESGIVLKKFSCIINNTLNLGNNIFAIAGSYVNEKAEYENGVTIWDANTEKSFVVSTAKSNTNLSLMLSDTSCLITDGNIAKIIAFQLEAPYSLHKINENLKQELIQTKQLLSNAMESITQYQKQLIALAETTHRLEAQLGQTTQLLTTIESQQKSQAIELNDMQGEVKAIHQSIETAFDKINLQQKLHAEGLTKITDMTTQTHKPLFSKSFPVSDKDVINIQAAVRGLFARKELSKKLETFVRSKEKETKFYLVESDKNEDLANFIQAVKSNDWRKAMRIMETTIKVEPKLSNTNKL